MTTTDNCSTYVEFRGVCTCWEQPRNANGMTPCAVQFR